MVSSLYYIHQKHNINPLSSNHYPHLLRQKLYSVYKHHFPNNKTYKLHRVGSMLQTFRLVLAQPYIYCSVFQYSYHYHHKYIGYSEHTKDQKQPKRIRIKCRLEVRLRYPHYHYLKYNIVSPSMYRNY